MNLKKLGLFFSLSALLGVSLTTTKALTQESEPSIE